MENLNSKVLKKDRHSKGGMLAQRFAQKPEVTLEDCVLGIDLGGTNVRAGLVKNGTLLQKVSQRINRAGTADEILQQIFAVTDPFMKGQTVREHAHNNMLNIKREGFLKGNSDPLMKREIAKSMECGAGSQIIPTPEATFPGCRVEAIGVGVPSVVDTQQGIVYDVQHIPSWKEVHLKEILETRYEVPVSINNDANAFTLGEYYFGAGRCMWEINKGSPSDAKAAADTAYDRGEHTLSNRDTKMYDSRQATLESKLRNKPKKDRSLVGLTIGTGVGCGLMLKGALFEGARCGAGEFGAIAYLDRNLEYYASGSFFRNVYKIDGDIAFLAAQNGESWALEAFETLGGHIGSLIKTVLYALDPDQIVLGGSVAASWQFFEKTMRHSISGFDFPSALASVKILPSVLSDSAILGAASLAIG